MERHLNICLSRESSEIGEIRQTMIGDTAPQHKAGHRPPLSEEPGQCTEKDWSHPEQRVIEYVIVKYNTLNEYIKSSTVEIEFGLKHEKVNSCYSKSSCEDITHHVAAPGLQAGAEPG